MRTATRAFWMPKDLGYEDEYEDAYALDEVRGVAAMADGVSSAIFSGSWASILTRAVVAGVPPLDGPEFWPWLGDQRQIWRSGIDVPALKPFQREKLRQCGGAFTTLLWVEWSASADDPSEVAWNSYAVGDSGLWHVRGLEVLQSFPIGAVEELAGDPVTICSLDHRNDHALEFRAAAGIARPGDTLVLCTDALLGWALAELANGSPPDWDEFWAYDDAAWRERIEALRQERRIRCDDTTLVLVRFLASEADAPITLLPTADDDPGINPGVAPRDPE